MADAFTTALRLCKPEVGADEDTWGTVLNGQTIDMIDEAVGGYVAISVAGGNVTLTTNNGTTDQARNMVIKFTGSPGTDRTITAPDVEKTYWLINGVGDSSNILFKATGGATVTIPAGCQAKVYTDGATNAVILLLYGEGTYTPAVSFGGASVGITYTVQVGSWTRVGNLMRVSGYVSLSSKGSSTGVSKITLPVASANVTNNRHAVAVLASNMASGVNSVEAQILPGVAQWQQHNFSAGMLGTMADTDFLDNSILVFTATYQAA